MPKRNQKHHAKTQPPRRYVGDAGTPLQGAGQTAAVGFPLVLLACITGFVVGLFVWGMLRLSEFLTNLLWDGLPSALSAALPDTSGLTWLPLAVCTTGGLVIGAWTRAFHNSPDSLETVMAQVGTTGEYHLASTSTSDAASAGSSPADTEDTQRPESDEPATQPKGRPIALVSAVSFLLPLAFGGSVGPEAGLSGLIAAACTWMGNMLKRAGLAAKSVVDLTVSATLSAVFATPFLGIVAAVEEGGGAPNAAGFGNGNGLSAYTFRRPAKIILYTAAAMGAFGGIVVLVELFGAGSGLPRFDGVEGGLASLAWAVPLSLLGWMLAVIYRAAEMLFRAASRALGEHPIIKPVIAGVALGLAGCAFPNVLFSGEAQSREIVNTWTQAGAWALLATGALKVVATPLCLNFGWRGGHFFPCIFAGVSFGYGCSALTGLDPMLCVTAVATALMAGIMRRPLAAMALLVICFPLDGILVIGIAALVGTTLPVPSFQNAPQPGSSSAS